VPTGVKVIFTVASVAILPFVLWSLRPSQKRAVSSSWFRLGSKDPVFYGLFRSDGTPRKYSWVFTIAWFAIFLGIVWMLPTS